MKVLILLFLPFFLNLAIYQLLWLQVPHSLWSENPEEARIEFTVLLQTYSSPLMSLIQTVFGVYSIKTLGGIRDLYSKRDLAERPLKSVLLIMGLIPLSWSLFMLEGFINMVVQKTNWEEYRILWSESMKHTPIESK